MTEILPFRFKPVGGKQVADEIRLLGREGKTSLDSVRGAARPVPRDFQRIEQSAGGAARGVGGLGTALNRLKGLAGGVFAGLSIERLTRVGAASLQAADDIGAAAAAAGLSAERFQSLTFAFEQFDVSSQQTADGLRRLGRRFGEFRNSGAGPAAAAIRQLGLEQDILSGKIADVDPFLNAVIDRLGRVGDESRVAALAAQLFGDDAGPLLAVALRQGTAAIAEQEERARDLGLVIDEALVEAGGRANKELATLRQSFATAFDAGVINRFAGAAGELGGRMDDVAMTGRELGELLGGGLRLGLENVDTLVRVAAGGLALLAGRTAAATVEKLKKTAATVAEARADREAAAAALAKARADKAAAAAALEAAVAAQGFLGTQVSLKGEQRRLARATRGLAAAQDRHTAAMARANVAARALSRGLAFFGGLPGLLVTAGTAFLLLRDNTSATEAATEALTEAERALGRQIEETTRLTEAQSQEEQRLEEIRTRRARERSEAALEQARSEAAGIIFRPAAGQPRSPLIQLADDVRDGVVSVSKAVEQVQELGFGRLAISLEDVEEAAIKAERAIRALNEGRVATVSLEKSVAGLEELRAASSAGDRRASSLPDDLRALQEAAARRLDRAGLAPQVRQDLESTEQRLLALRKQFPDIEESILKRLVAQEVVARKLAEKTDATRKAAEEERAAREAVSENLDDALAKAAEEERLLRARLAGKEDEVRIQLEIERLVAGGIDADDVRLQALRQRLETAAMLTEEIKKQQDAQREADRLAEEVKRQREEDFRDLSDTFFDLFSDRGASFWSAFKAAGLRALADLAAASFLGGQVAPSAAGRRSGLFGGLLSGLSGGGGPTQQQQAAVAGVRAGAQRAVANAPPGFFATPADESAAVMGAVAAVQRSLKDDDGILERISGQFSRTFRQEFRDFGKLLSDAFEGLGVDFSQLFGDELKKLPELLGQAGGGAAVGFATSSILKGLGIDASSTGGAIGGAVGSFLPVPGGSIIGSIFGSLLGGLFGSTPRGGATLTSNAFGRFDIDSFGNKRGREEEAIRLGFGSISTIRDIAEAVGGEIAAGINIGTIGTRKKRFTFDPTGQGRTKGSGVEKFDTEEQALAAQLATALSRGIIEGVGVTAGRLLRQATTATIEQVVEDAAKLESVPRRLKALVDPLGAALDELNREFRDLRNTFEAVGATTEEMAVLEELFAQERAQLIEQEAEARTRVLRDFLRELETGSASPLSLREQRALVAPEFEALARQIDAGQGVDPQEFRRVAAELLNIERELAGSTPAFFALFDEVRELTDRAIANAERSTGIEDVESPFPDITRLQDAGESTARDMAAVRELLERLVRATERPAPSPTPGPGFGSGGGFDARSFLPGLRL